MKDITGICETRNVINNLCPNGQKKMFNQVIVDGKLSLTNSDFQKLQTGSFIDHDHNVIANLTMTALQCEERNCLFRLAATTFENEWQPITETFQTLLVPSKEMTFQYVTVPLLPQALSQFSNTSYIHCLRVTDTIHIRRAMIESQHLSRTTDFEGYRYYVLSNENFENVQRSQNILFEFTRPNEITAISLNVHATSATDQCTFTVTSTITTTITTTQTTSPTTTRTTKSTTTLTTTSTTTLPTTTTIIKPPLCGFSTNIKETYGFTDPPNNGDNPCGVHANCQQNCPTKLPTNSCKHCKGNHITSWAQPNKQFWGEITTQCPTGTTCKQAEEIGRNSNLNPGYEEALCAGSRPTLQSLKHGGFQFFGQGHWGLDTTYSQYNYTSTHNGCAKSFHNVDSSINCLCRVREGSAHSHHHVCESHGSDKWAMHAHRCMADT